WQATSLSDGVRGPFRPTCWVRVTTPLVGANVDSQPALSTVTHPVVVRQVTLLRSPWLSTDTGVSGAPLVGSKVTSFPLAPSTAVHWVAVRHETDTRSAPVSVSPVACGAG